MDLQERPSPVQGQYCICKTPPATREGIPFFFHAEDGIRDWTVTGVQTCALPSLAQQAEANGGAAQCDGDYPGDYQHRRDRRDVDAEQIELDEPHRCAPVPK